ncbi:uncharacterized protein GJ701_000757 isoform 2-T2 [Geothlypis trichas]
MLACQLHTNARANGAPIFCCSTEEEENLACAIACCFAGLQVQPRNSLRCLSPPKALRAVSQRCLLSPAQPAWLLASGSGRRCGAVLGANTCHTRNPCGSQPGSGTGTAPRWGRPRAAASRWQRGGGTRLPVRPGRRPARRCCIAGTARPAGLSAPGPPSGEPRSQPRRPPGPREPLSGEPRSQPRRPPGPPEPAAEPEGGNMPVCSFARLSQGRGLARLCKSAHPGIHRDVNLRICSSGR